MDPSRRAQPPRQLRALLQGGTLAGLSDAQLLDRFAARRDEVSELAFAVLVERHGPAILRVCRGVLGNPHDAEDAFQATFLVLARKAETIRSRESVASWLHGVALRVAADARFVAARRRRHEREAASRRAESFVASEGRGPDPAVYEEIGRLPEPLRAAVVLCYLEGRTCEEAARQLGRPVGTVKSRLARARRRLHDRLRRRGLAPEAGLPAAGPIVADPPLPPTLTGATLDAVARFVSARVPTHDPGAAALLAQGVLRTMAITRWVKVGSFVLALGVTLAGADLLAQKAPRDDGPPAPAVAPTSAKSKHAFGSPIEVQAVRPGKLKLVVFSRGTIVPTGWSHGLNPVEGSRAIEAILPEGSRVEKGQVVCELDASDLEAKLAGLVGSGRADGPEAASLRTQIGRCRLEAPRDGLIVHGNDLEDPEQGHFIEVGAMVRERQVVFRVLDPEGPVRVSIDLPEALLKRVRQGQAVRLRFDAFETFTGRVERATPQPNMKRHLSRDGFTYKFSASIDDRPAWLRAGMIGWAEVLIPELEDVLSVPRPAVVYYGGKDHVAVKRPDGGFDWREVVLGGHGAQSIEIQEGVRDGEEVALNPLALMSPEERKAKLGPGPRADANDRR